MRATTDTTTTATTTTTLVKLASQFKKFQTAVSTTRCRIYRGPFGAIAPMPAGQGGPPASLQQYQVWTVSLSHTGHNQHIVAHYALAALPFNLPNWQIKSKSLN